MKTLGGLNKKTKRLLKELPLLQEAVWEAKRLGRRISAYNGRWDRLREWLSLLDQAPGQQVVGDEWRVLVFAPFPFFLDYSLAVSTVLIARGCQVDVLWLPYLDAVGSVEEERFQKWSDRFPIPQDSRLPLFQLLDVPPADSSEELVAIARDVADFDTCYIRQKEVCELNDCPEDRRLFDFRFARNLDCLRRLETFLATRHYDAALVGNGRLWEMGCFRPVCDRRGIPCVSFDTFEIREELVVSRTGAAIDWDTNPVWKADEPHELTPERERRVLDRIAFRHDPDRQGDYKLQSVRPEEEEALRAKLRLDSGKRLALLCTNVAWDTAVLRKARAFPTMYAWYMESIAWFAQNPGWQLVVRAHPAEVYCEQEMSVVDYIHQGYPELPPNVRVVRPGDKTSTYGLMRIADLGLSFTSTVGLEMAVDGLPVITAGRVHYAGKGFTMDPANPAEYFQSLEQVSRNPNYRLPRHLVELAWCYFDTYFEKFPKKVPWRPWAMKKDMQMWPMLKVLRGDCPEEFLRTFDYLAGRQVPGMV